MRPALEILPLEIPDVLEIRPRVFGDGRGYFAEVFQAEAYAPLKVQFVQDNLTDSAGGVLRGLHYQIRQPQGKLVTALAGEVFDVAVDMRRSSATFGRWTSLMLSGERLNQIWVPPGFAHGYYIISDRALVSYKVTEFYAPELERTLLWNDPQLGIHWPLIDGRAPTLSLKDTAGVSLVEAETYA